VPKSQQRCCSGDVVTTSGSEFHSLAPMTGKARSPSVECRVAGTIKAAVDAERSLCLGRRSDTVVNSLARHNAVDLLYTKHAVQQTLDKSK